MQAIIRYITVTGIESIKFNVTNEITLDGFKRIIHKFNPNFKPIKQKIIFAETEIINDEQLKNIVQDSHENEIQNFRLILRK